MFRSICLTALMVAGGAAEAADVSSPSKIDAVTVFPDQAQVVRTLKTHLDAGAQVLVVSDLPAGIDAESVRVEAAGGPRIEIGSVDIRTVTPPPPEVKLTSEAEQKIRALTVERSGLDDRIQAAQAKLKLIERLGSASTEGFVKGIGEGKTAPSLIKDSWAAFGEGIDESLAAMRTAHVRQAEIDDEIARIRADIGHQPQPSSRYGEARLALAVDGSGDATFRISYRMTRAGWQPVYDARLTSGSGSDKPSVELVTRALVRQATGEDWTDVDLTLSTARPSRGTAAPVVKPIIVQFWQPPMPVGVAPASIPAPMLKSRVPMPETQDEAAPRAQLAAPPPPEAPKPAAEREAQLDSTGTTAVFHVPGKVSVETGVGGRAMKVASSKLEPQLSIKTAPRLAAIAYLTASFRPQGDASLLPGRVSIYRDGEFVGTGNLPFVASGDDVKLGFGEDDRVKVERVAVKQTEGETGTFTSTHFENHDFKIKVKNLRDRPVPITVEDQIPVSESAEITVDKLSTMTPPSKVNVDDRRGVMNWAFELKPGEEKEIRVGWRLKFPADRMVMTNTPDK
ncbi:MAG: mucoidy inhibitor MuiA family protein [Ancalomicrobiaceae bacterium]|nr:mucoidy inhibitor MuiA family protein [Ancalomicrobiaceae bacterium]